MNDTDATAIFAPLWRRKWLILAVAVLVAAGSYLYYRNQTKLFQSATVIYLGASAEEGGAAEKSAHAASADAASQVAVLTQIVIPSVRRQLASAHDAASTAKVSAKTTEKSQFLTITAEAHTARVSARLANEVATAYIKRANAARRRGINTQIEIAQRQLRRIEVSTAAPSSKSGKSGTAASSVIQETTLQGRINQLEAGLSVIGAQHLSPAGPLNARLLSPKPRKNAEFGFAIGLLLASIFAYVLGRLDRRMRTLASIEGVFGVQIMGALPRVRRPIVVRDGTPSPSKNLLEPLRGLHAALKLPVSVPEDRARSNGAPPAAKRSPRVILVTSADVGDGKSMLVADLAFVQRDAGQRVAVVDANMRRPAQAKLLGLGGTHGLADVLSGALEMQDAMQGVAGGASPPEPTPAAAGGLATAVRTAGSISVLASAGGDANPGALLAGESMAHLIASLSESFDSVLIDGPSPLEVSDVMPLLSLVDGVLVIARIGHTREPPAERLAQVLREDGRAPLLGVVANSVAPKQIQRHGLSAATGRSWAPLARR
jgi:Mrp family chromosome partitioning ATPase/capsular polysaccharide biosynthesis protein